MKKFNLIVIALLISLLSSSSALGANDEKSESSSKKEPQKPVKVIIVSGKDDTFHYTEPNGPSVMIQTFAFDREKKQTGPAGGPLIITVEGIPIPISLSIGSLNSASSSMSPIYADTLLELQGLAVFKLGILFSVEGQKLSHISIMYNDLKTVRVSSDYTVYPDSLSEVKGGGPFVNLIFDWKTAEKPEALTGCIVLKRNGKEILESAIKPAKKLVIPLKAVADANDYVEWFVKDTNGNHTHEGILGFPVRGAIPDLVSYNVVIQAVPLKGKKEN